MKPSSTASSLAVGALLALLLTAPLLALLYLANSLLGVPFVPFDLFDWLIRVLPGSVITTGIDSMVGLLSALGLSVADLAKLAEQAMAVGLTLGLAGVGGAVFYALHRRGRAPWRSGLLFGLAVGVPLAAISATRQGATPLDGLWVLVALGLWGVGLVWLQRRLAPRAETASAERVNRRQFLVRVGGAAALITVAGASVGSVLSGRREELAVAAEGQRWSEGNALPNANAAVEPVQGTRPEYTPLEQYYRIDINLTPPVVREDDWRLRVEGLVAAPLELSLAELRAYEPAHQFITMACISNTVGGELTSTTRWTGVLLRRLLGEWGLEENATHLRIVSTDGFFEYVAVADIESDERIMLCYAWDGVPLRIRNGFPLRIYIPDLYGMKQPKWIESIEAVDAWEPGYWVVRGWDETARMQTTSVIDTVSTNMMLAEAQTGTDAAGTGEASTGEASTGQMSIPIGGIAHAGARGIGNVEVRVDGGEWQAAELREPMSGLTWVLWRFEWPFEPGEHTFAVRCTDGLGELQIAQRRSPHPSGATGLDNERVTL